MLMSKACEEESDAETATNTTNKVKSSLTNSGNRCVVVSHVPNNKTGLISDGAVTAAPEAAQSVAMAGNVIAGTSRTTQTCVKRQPANSGSNCTTVVDDDVRKAVHIVEADRGQPAEKPKKSTTSKRGKKSAEASNTSSGRWTRAEHEAFLEGLKVHGREWKKVAERITTRTSAQIRSHAQKYFAKLAKEGSLERHAVEENGATSDGDQLHCASGRLNGSYVSSSILSKIEKITQDPGCVQQEVEHTLGMLHERYRQLQIQLQEAQRQQHKQHPPISSVSTPCPATEDHETSKPATAALAKVEEEEHEKQIATIDTASLRAPVAQHSEEANEGSIASLSSTDSLRGEMTRIPHNRELELIALEVLGGGLPSRKRKASMSSLTEETSSIEGDKKRRCTT